MSRMHVVLAAVSSSVLLAGCGAERPKSAGEIPITVPIEVIKPVAVGCVPPNLSSKPAYPDTDDALRSAPGAAERYQLLYAGRKLRDARLNEIEPIVDGPNACPKAAARD